VPELTEQLDAQLTAQRAIGVFLKGRQQLIVQLMRLSKAVEHNDGEQTQLYLVKFCQTLVDYLSNGYFRIYGELLTPRTWATPRVYSIFESTTSTAMTFNDRHTRNRTVDPASVRQELTSVALALETRFELEDEMLSRSHEPQAMAV